MSEMSVCTPSNEVQCRLFRLPLRFERAMNALGASSITFARGRRE